MTTETGHALTRIAPTPSGFLHAGNLLNFLLIQRLASEHSADIALRIDDMDAFRLRPEYVADIFRCLQWLGICWSIGPQSMAEYELLPSPEERADHYYDALTDMIGAGLPAFVCRCSRRDLGRDARCEKGCADKRLPFVPRKTLVRVRIPAGADPEVVAMGDTPLWRREDLPAYQLTSIIDDHELGVTHIVRGEDLRPSTELQLWLARFLPDSPFLRAEIRHHHLVTDDAGQKLSKSQGTGMLELTPALRERLEQLVESAVWS